MIIMAKKTENKQIEEIRKYIESEKVIIGTEVTLKKLKSNDLNKVFLSSNIPEDIKEDIMHYSSLQDIEIINLDILNDELGVICKKPFSVSLLGILK